MKRNFLKLAEATFSQVYKSSTKLQPQGLRSLSVSFSSQAQQANSTPQNIPAKCDVCIIGGGAMGSSTAFWLKRHPAGRNLNVVVVERDPKYTKASTVLSLGGIRQQFSIAENVALSLFGVEFLKRIQEYLGVPGEAPADALYHQGPYLFIATTPEGVQTLHENHAVQRGLGSKVELLSKEKLKARFPYLNVDDILLASVGIENEGWFDPWSLLNGFKRKAISLGVQYVTAEVVGFDAQENVNLNVGPTQLHLQEESGNVRSLEFSQCVIAAGYESGKIAKLAGIGTGNGVLSVPLPVEPKKRYVYYVHAPTLAEASKDFPLLIDSTGTYIRPAEGACGNFFTGRSPNEEDEPSVETLDVDYSFFDNQIWPFLVNRIPELECLKIKSAWGGYYDYNLFDQNGVIGTHPCFRNFHLATGFSGHGIQQSPAVGRAMMELILDGSFKSIDLTRFDFERFVEGKQVLEKNIV